MESPSPADQLERLLDDDEPQEVVWAAFERADAELRRALVDRLRARVEEAVRTRPPRALALSERLLRAARDVPERAALAARGRAMALHANGRSAEALEPYLRALDLHEAAGERVDAARVRRSLVDVHQMAGDAPAALREAERARSELRELGETRLLAQLECNVGNVHFRLDRFREAERCYREAIALFESLGDAFGRAFALYNLGNVHTNSGAFEAAEADFAEAEARFLEGGHQVYAADARYAAAYLEFRRGRFAEAIAGLEAARAGYGGDAKPTGVALCELDLAEVHLSLGALRDALGAARAARAEFARLGLVVEEAKAALFVGIACAQLGQVTDARRAFDDAEASCARLGNRTKGALIALQRAALAGSAAQARERLAASARAVDELVESGDELLAAAGRLTHAELCLTAGDSSAARAALEVLLAAPRPAGARVRGLEIDARGVLARLHQLLGDPAAARSELRLAIDGLEATYARLSARDARLAFFRDRQALYAELAAHEAADGRPADAVALVELGRQRSLEEGPAPGVAGDPELAAARARVETLLALRLDAGGAPGERRLDRAPVVDELVRAEDALMDLLRARRRGESAAPRRADELATTLAAAVRADEDLVYFLADSQGLWALHRGDGAWHRERLAVGVSECAAWLRRWRYGVHKARLGAAYSRRHAEALAAARRALLRELGAALLAPLVERLARPRLTVVPYGILHELPLHALLAGEAPLLADRAIVHARSLRQLARCRAAPAPGPRRIAAAGSSADLPAIASELRALERLHGARLERLPATDLPVHLRQGGAAPALLHLVAHGSFRADHPLFSGLALEGRFLSALDIREFDLTGSLVVLSGCETGRLGVSRGEELFGPEQAFLAAGARAVVSSLWPVSDVDAARFMADLHAELAAGAPAADALACAQRAAGPGDLAALAFLLCGDPDARLASDGSGCARRG